MRTHVRITKNVHIGIEESLTYVGNIPTSRVWISRLPLGARLSGGDQQKMNMWGLNIHLLTEHIIKKVNIS